MIIVIVQEDSWMVRDGETGETTAHGARAVDREKS